MNGFTSGPQQEAPMNGKLRLTCRGPGGPLEDADREWVRAMRRDRVSWIVIASYFVPLPSVARLKRIATKRRRFGE